MPEKRSAKHSVTSTPVVDMFESEIVPTAIPKEDERDFSLLDSNVYVCKPKEPKKPKPFPAKLPASEVISRTVEALPKLTLRNGYPLTYTGLVSDVCNNLVMRQRNLEKKKKNGERTDENEEMTAQNYIDKLNAVCY